MVSKNCRFRCFPVPVVWRSFCFRCPPDSSILRNCRFRFRNSGSLRNFRCSPPAICPPIPESRCLRLRQTRHYLRNLRPRRQSLYTSLPGSAPRIRLSLYQRVCWQYRCCCPKCFPVSGPVLCLLHSPVSGYPSPGRNCFLYFPWNCWVPYFRFRWNYPAQSFRDCCDLNCLCFQKPRSLYYPDQSSRQSPGQQKSRLSL